MEIPQLVVGNKVAPYAIVQGGMSVRISLHRLAAAVANAGGVGTIGATAIPLSELRQEIRASKALTSGVVGVNVMYAGRLFDQALEVCIQERVDFMAIGAGLAREPFRRLGEAGIPGFPIISSAKAARLVARFEGVYGVIVESGHAGGHLGPKDPNQSTWDLLPEVVDTLRQTGFTGPIIAAGGILTREDIERALSLGADGVQMGTRFAMTEESAASPAMKAAWIRATGSQVEKWSPTGMWSRAIVPHTDEHLPRLDGATLRCQHCLKQCLHREDHAAYHCIRQSLVNAQSGDVENGLVFCGSRVGEIRDILPVAEVFRRLLQDQMVAVG